MYVRFQTGGGTNTSRSAVDDRQHRAAYGNNVAVPLGNRPAYPGKRPPYKPTRPVKQTLPNLNGPAAS